MAAALGHVDLTADDRIDPSLPALGVELDHAVEVAVVGDSERIEAFVFGPTHQIGDMAEAVE